jgi:UDP-3-O-[3-hydroxymyristoyl] glucosamine N-acyltransferase
MVELSDIVELVGSDTQLSTAQNQTIGGIAPLDNAAEGQITFLSSAKYRRQLANCNASAVLIAEKDREHCPANCTAIIVDDPYLAYAKVSRLFDLTPRQEGIHDSAVVHPEARLAEGVCIGANAVIGKGVKLANGAEVGPGAVLEEYVEVGSYSRIGANVSVLHRCIIGSDCLIQAGTVIGSKGFGYAPDQGRWEPISQLGRVVIGDRVELGANCSIDRGAVEDTVIADDVIIDNAVHIAHNVKVGKSTALAAQVGIAGSTDIGSGCTAGGQVGITGHISIADNSHFTGQAMVTKGTTEPGLYSSGLPATTNREWRKMVARLRQLESMQQKIKDLEQRLNQEGDE